MKRKIIFWLAPLFFKKVLVPVAIKGYKKITRGNTPFVLLLFATTLLSSGALAQDAKSLLKEVDTKVKSYQNIAIDFKYALSNDAEGVNQETKGTVVMAGNRYKLDLMGTTQLFDGKNIYTIVPEDEEVTVSPISDQDENTITPSKMLSFFNEGYTQKMDISQKVNGREIQFVKLTPMDSDSDIKYSLLGVDAQTKHIHKLIITQKNNTKITITVNSFKPNQPLAKNAFTFDESKFTDYYINRL